jgi:hypothetical protein
MVLCGGLFDLSPPLNPTGRVGYGRGHTTWAGVDVPKWLKAPHAASSGSNPQQSTI